MTKSTKNTYWMTVEISWEECVSADSEIEAVKKLLSKYKEGKGRIPREYVDVHPSDGFLEFQVD